ncbi:hypothetical protein BJ912DRAFT_1040726 [Pholiota molesta]|nr:hypothetical protein BJ912DRAFT_1040726 [Pholiota molesta]
MSDEKQKVHVDSDIIIEEVQLGLWKLKLGHPPSLNLRRLLDIIKSAYPLYSRLFLDIYRISPRHFTFFLMCQAWKGVEAAILLHLSSSLLSQVEQGLLTGNPDKIGILWLIVLQISCSLDVTLSILRSRVTSYFNLYLMKAKLQVDIPTSQEIASTPEGSASDAWQSLEDIIRFLTELLTVFSQLALIAALFALLCISKPITSALFAKYIWHKVCFAFVDNKDYQRRKALEAFADGTYRQDIVANNLNGWIVHEYEKAHANWGLQRRGSIP